MKFGFVVSRFLFLFFAHFLSPMSSQPITIGVEITSGPEVPKLMAIGNALEFQFGLCHLIRQDSNLLVAKTPLGTSLAHSQLMVLDQPEYTASIVGVISPWIDLDSKDAAIRSRSELLLHQQVR